ncbi:MAG: 1-acyl-sn-glycerol-3-phosphate acyltransferase [Scytolyngbya sp. HA4215-MV1]|jgi:1-acyl-sn-glycerol-3-phosphate acyltransferase|nr:1-acyl-sn-glycerol-3-phosphate acyltransferase [Scytolyngbya sp. HA4215-MV1]
MLNRGYDRNPNHAKVSANSFRFGWFEWFCLWFPPGWLILFNRHWQHYRPDPDGWNNLEYALFLIPGGFYVAFLLRWLRLGGRSPRSASELQPDPAYQQAFRDEILAPILQHYFRAEFHPHPLMLAHPPAIVVMNHAGMCFPWDFLGLAGFLSQEQGWLGRPLAHPIFFDHPWLRWWLPNRWAQVMGAVRADRESLEAAIAEKNLLLYAPEGWRGLIKGQKKQYQLETFDPSFIRLSARYQVPILPVVCLGNEALHPWAVNLHKLADWLGLPLFPISPLMPLFLLFPSMGVWVARSRLRYFVQTPYCPWVEQDPTQLQRRAIAYHEAEKVRETLQQAIDRLLKGK